MASIHLTTFIAAPVDRVFDLSRNLAVYKYVFNSREEKFSAASGSNLLTKGETVSILAKHAGKTRMSTLKITDLQKPVTFTEEQIKGDLESFHHVHHFKSIQNGTIIIDLIEFGNPRDIIGKIIGRLYLKSYLEEIVRKRNDVIRSYAETEKWRAVLS
jgi:ligand-binding SRPBCC domain-containing protein